MKKPKRLSIWWNWRTASGRARMICAYLAFQSWDEVP